MAALSPDFPLAGDASLEAGKTLADYLGIVRRRRATLGLVFVLLFSAAVIVAVVLPPVYRSTATILIKEQEIPQELVRSTVTSFADERIQVISQQVMTRSTLLDMVDKYGLYGKARQRETSEEIIDRMRADIKLTPISADVTDRRTGSPIKATIAFSLSYDSEVAANAQKIANELTTLFLNENVKNRQQKAAETTSFLDEELTRVSDHISELEKQLTEFKGRNQDRLPELSASNLVGSERSYSDIQRLDRDIAFMQERKASLQRQLADTKPTLPVVGSSGAIAEPQDRLVALQSELASLVGTYSEEHPDIKRMRREIANLKAETGLQDEAADREAKLNELQAQISLLRQKYSDEHPDVVRLKRTYAAIESALKAGGETAGGQSANLPRARRADNPAYLNLKEQIDTADAQVQSMQTERQALRARLEQFDTRLAQTPEAEREYLELARDIDSSRARFRELREKQMQAQVAEQLERGRKAERFTLIEPPIYPEKPYRPNRALIVLVGLLLAVGGGVGAVALRELLDQTVHSARDVVRVMQVPVLAVIPTLRSAAWTRRRRLRIRWAMGGVLLLVVIALVAFHFFYMPLDVAWYGVLRRVYN